MNDNTRETIEVIKKIARCAKESSMCDGICSGCVYYTSPEEQMKACDMAVKALGTMPDACQPVWTPCSQKQPEKSGYYRVTYRTSVLKGDIRYTGRAAYVKKDNRWYGAGGQVLAWKEDEGPWKGDKDGSG